jgi:hypothetical protein
MCSGSDDRNAVRMFTRGKCDVAGEREIERDVPDEKASGGNVGRLKFCSGICAALAWLGSTGF